MITLHLFKASNPFQEIDTCKLSHGELTIGRDAACGWRISDESRGVSRRHCTLMVEGERIFLRDTSANGVLIGAEKRPAPPGERCELAAGETLHVGDFTIVLDGEEEDAGADRAPQPRRTPTVAPGVEAATRPPGALTDAALLEAFCRGASLEASSFAGEDPAAVMERLGVIYREVVDDLCAMMRDRATLKDQLRLDRTTISARANNLMKWAPPEQVAVDLLQEGENGFLKGADAFKASFADLRRHGVCLMGGSDAAIAFVLTQLDPSTLEEKARRQSLPPFTSKLEAAWKLLRDSHTALSGEPGDVVIEKAFRRGYEQRLTALPDEEQAA
jgi:predicted component of type VI protein secretion system